MIPITVVKLLGTYYSLIFKSLISQYFYKILVDYILLHLLILKSNEQMK